MPKEEQELIKEDSEEEDSSTEDLVPVEEQLPSQPMNPTVAPKYWDTDPSGEGMGHGLPIYERAWVKVPTMQVGSEPQALTDEDLAC